jgi:hypothetical protein
MPVNHYFNNFNSKPEQRLMEDLMVETIKINGVDVHYIPNVNDAARDLIYGEDPLRKFKTAYPIEVYIVNVDGYEGEREFFSKFGLEIRNNMSVILSKRSFARWLPQSLYDRPREGDLIYIPFLSQTGEMYEIKFVNYTDSFYVLGNKYPYFYKLELEKFKYSQEDISVGVPMIDDIVVQDSYTISMNVNTVSGNGNYLVGEYVHNPANTAFGLCTYWNVYDGVIKITDLVGTFSSGMYLVGNTSNAFHITTSSPDDLVDPQEREMYDNKLIQVEATNYVDDIIEINPFGRL